MAAAYECGGNFTSSWIHPQTSIGDGFSASGVIINKPSIIRAGAELSRVVCSSAVDLNGSLANMVAYQNGVLPATSN